MQARKDILELLRCQWLQRGSRHNVILTDEDSYHIMHFNERLTVCRIHFKLKQALDRHDASLRPEKVKEKIS